MSKIIRLRVLLRIVQLAEGASCGNGRYQLSEGLKTSNKIVKGLVTTFNKLFFVHVLILELQIRVFSSIVRCIGPELDHPNKKFLLS